MPNKNHPLSNLAMLFFLASSCNYTELKEQDRSPGAKPTKPLAPQLAPSPSATPSPAVPLTDILKFEQIFAEVLKRNCVPCHNATKARGDFNLETYASIIASGNVVCGMPADSVIMQQINSNSMPPASKGPLTIKEKNLVSRWISEGCKE